MKDINISDNKLKLISICQQIVKNNVYMIIFAMTSYQFVQQYKIPDCSSQNLILSISMGNISLLIVNLVCCIYLCCKKHFPRCEFVILYFLNFVWFISILILTIKRLFYKNKIDCMPYMMAEVFVILSALKNEIEILMIIFLPIGFTNRQLTQCTNLIFAVLFLKLSQRNKECKSNNIFLLTLVSVIIFLFMFINFVINYLGMLKKYLMAISRARLFFFIIQIIIFTFLWALIFRDVRRKKDIDFVKNPVCQQSFTLKINYVVLLPLSILFMIFMIIVREIKQNNDEKNIFEHDIQQIAHIQMQEEYDDNMNTSELDINGIHKFDHQKSKEISKSIYGTLVKK